MSNRFTAISSCLTVYDGDGQLDHTFSGSGASTITTTPPVYDDLGRVTTSTDNFGGQTHTLYDAGGNVVQSTYPDHTLTRSVHDSAGRIIWSIDRYSPGDLTTPRPVTLTHYDPATGRVLYTARFANVVIGLSTDPGGKTYSTTVTTPTAAPLSISRQLVDGFGRAIELETPTERISWLWISRHCLPRNFWPPSPRRWRCGRCWRR